MEGGWVRRTSAVAPDDGKTHENRTDSAWGMRQVPGPLSSYPQRTWSKETVTPFAFMVAWSFSWNDTVEPSEPDP